MTSYCRVFDRSEEYELPHFVFCFDCVDGDGGNGGGGLWAFPPAAPNVLVVPFIDDDDGF